ncbi:MAG: hypothetical protein OEY11_13815 [Gammaproteobacteria bacterium]|nr:hypothetical protein [Gammaproteobacteria bacterium]
MNRYKTLLIITSLSLLAATGCEDISTSNNAHDWVVSADNAELIIADILAFKEATNTVSDSNASDSTSGLRSNRALILTDLNCSVSGTYTLEIGDPIIATFTDCDNGNGPATGSVNLSVQGFGTSFVTTSLNLDLTSADATAFGSLVLTHDFSTAGVPYTYDLDLTLNTAAGTVTVVNEPVFSGLGLNPPDAGEMLITGPNNGKIRLTAINGLAYIDIDADRDGTFEYIGTGIPWANLQQP